ncbi:alpha/beta fold hydrolase [Streptomyces europaeiscabiei]|uniref:alpha/beta fold hydrolase n=1 Tax=Streptomyces europaeiscabiei TaxID=146819 RepID=UPI000765A292|nr:alpha/beta hydrolase [Streptomyces europaeiscabiei]MDX3863408.1 alpha/beta hydrolase [Streptomyces europaeiscabiei]MDX3872871.1 alpha/beta hydrolase [Streptomyces europaeiscabiei]
MHATTTGALTTPDAIRLAYRDHDPGQGSGRTPRHEGGRTRTARQAPARTLLLLHGLAGHLGEWDELLPPLLAQGHRVVTYDARGHGASTGRPADMSRAACVRDTVTVIRELGLDAQGQARLTLVGQSLGGHTAFLAAAAHPELIHSLILIEAGPGAPDPALRTHIAAWMDSWPTPFDSPSRATRFFGHASWSRNLERRPDGWHPRADRATMLAAIEELAESSYDPEWAATTCPTLVVRGARGTMRAADAAKMPALRAPDARTDLAVIEDAGHDVHLDQPQRLYEAMAGFLNSLPTGNS